MDWPSVFGHKQDPEFQDFSTLVTDLHSHMIPGLDDGSASIAESLEMIRGMVDLGYRRLITTPHVMAGFAENSSNTILPGYKALQQAIKNAGIEVELFAAAEYMVNDELEDLVKKRDLLTFSNNHVLLELSPYFPHPNFKSMLFDLNVAGYTVVLAHVERYAYWFDDLGFIEELKSGGVLIQTNIVSFAGYYSPIYRKHAEILADAGLIDILGSDLHRPGTLPLFKEALHKKSVQKLLGSGILKNCFL